MASNSGMDSFEVNKVLGAVLFTLLALQALSIGAGALLHPRPAAKPGYEVAGLPTQGEAAKEAAKPAEEPIEQALAKADPKHGQAVAKICQTCHTLQKGEPNKVGPNLWDVVGRPRASEAGFAYSDPMESKGGNWTVDELNKFLAGPREYIPGTKMTFAGLPKENERADVIAYLDTLSDNPKPLPTAAPPSAAQPPAAQAPAAQAPAAQAPAAPPPAAANPPAGEKPAAPKPQ
jgi:cytochrome c